MNLTELTAISPIDGRYRKVSDELSEYFSEFALIKYRVHIEIEYFISLASLGLSPLEKLSKSQIESLRQYVLDFSIVDAQTIKDTEKVTNHDVKAVEYFVKEKVKSLNLEKSLEFIHFGLTSQDINNTAIPLSMKEAHENVIWPKIEEIRMLISKFAADWANIPMLAHTHGQPASPTRLGKEFKVFEERMTNQLKQLNSIPWSAKFGGATGNFNAHQVAFPKTDWIQFANTFVNDTLGLDRSQYTTQIEHYDNLAAYFDALKRINTILIDLCRDIWTYISMNYFKQKLKDGEIGSSAMPHKVNPIDFENAEGNLGLANAIFEHLSAKLPVSRLQRDLTDSTVLRNVGVPLSHSLIAYSSIMKGMNKLILNEDKLKQDLENNWAVVAEAIQTVLRREGYAKPYEALKALTRTHEAMSEKTIHAFIETLNVDATIKIELKKITPSNYTGISF